MDIESIFDRLTTLASIEVGADKREAFAEDIASILSYVEQLQTLELSDAALKRETKEAAQYRDDVVESCEPDVQEVVKKNFPGVTQSGHVEAHGALEHK